MEVVKRFRFGNMETIHFKGEHSEAFLSKNLGIRDKGDKWSVTVAVDGACDSLCKRCNYETAIKKAEQIIG